MRDEDAAEQLVDFFSQALSILKVSRGGESIRLRARPDGISAHRAV